MASACMLQSFRQVRSTCVSSVKLKVADVPMRFYLILLTILSAGAISFNRNIHTHSICNVIDFVSCNLFYQFGLYIRPKVEGKSASHERNLWLY